MTFRKILREIPDQKVRDSLAASMGDGILWAIMFGFGENNVMAFSVLFGANAFMTSLIQGSGQLAITVSQVLGAQVVSRHPVRKLLCMVGNVIHGLSWLLMFWGAVWLKSPGVIIAAYVVGLLATNFAGPGWMSWMNDLVPPAIRGVFWGKRNNIAGLVQFGAISASGIFLAQAKPLDFVIPAFGILFSLAFVVRTASIWYLQRQHEPPAALLGPKASLGVRRFIGNLGGTLFGRFVLFSILMTFSVNLMNPIVPVYLLKDLQLDYWSFTLITMSSMVVSFMAMSYWGPLSDRFGNYRILMVTGLLLPFLALGWVFGRSVPYLMVLQLINGFVWAGFNLCTSNYIFDSVEAKDLPASVALFNGFNNFLAFGGTMLGGVLSLLIQPWTLGWLSLGGYQTIFIISAVLRGLVFILVAGSFREVRAVEASPPVTFFYVYQPLTTFFNRLFTVADRVGHHSMRLVGRLTERHQNTYQEPGPPRSGDDPEERS